MLLRAMSICLRTPDEPLFSIGTLVQGLSMTTTSPRRIVMLCTGVMPGSFWYAPNLISLGRIPLGLVAAAALGWPDPIGTQISLLCCLLAGVSDWLDGLLARRFAMHNDLGLLLDPLADKLFAAALVVGLVLYRDFPLWLTAVIIGRDLLIILAAGLLARRHQIQVPSNLAGKYAFAAIMILMASAIIRYQFGLLLLSIVSLSLILLSIVRYAQVFGFVQRTGRLPQRSDTSVLRMLRIGATLLVSALYIAGLYMQFVVRESW